MHEVFKQILRVRSELIQQQVTFDSQFAADITSAGVLPADVMRDIEVIIMQISTQHL